MTLTTGMITREWIAIHRKHHARCETAEDPHSPQFYGIWRVLFGGVGLYRAEALNEDTLETYGRGAPDDWVERNVYSRFRYTGVFITLAIDLLLFGWVGIAIPEADYPRIATLRQAVPYLEAVLP